MITITRILSSPLITLAIVYDCKQVALAGCIAAGVSDWLDGYIAKTYNMRTTLGGILDPLADKIFIGSIALGLTAKGLIPIELSSLIICRDFSILAGALYLRSMEKLPEEKFFDLASTSTFIIAPSIASKANTFIQFSLLISTLSNYLVGIPQLEMLEPVWYLTGLSTVISGLSYLDGKGIRRFRAADSSKKEKKES
jgi:cardiolipin synthase (CMP-forming)